MTLIDKVHPSVVPVVGGMGTLNTNEVVDRERIISISIGSGILAVEGMIACQIYSGFQNCTNVLNHCMSSFMQLGHCFKSELQRPRNKIALSTKRQ